MSRGSASDAYLSFMHDVVHKLVPKWKQEDVSLEHVQAHVLNMSSHTRITPGIRRQIEDHYLPKWRKQVVALITRTCTRHGEEAYNLIEELQDPPFIENRPHLVEFIVYLLEEV